jgi:hypothetical protein
MYTIQTMGMSAAYYSTWCRMGDIAAGGFVYSMARFTPFLSNRWYNRSTAVHHKDHDDHDYHISRASTTKQLPPFTKKQRIIIEAMVTLSLMIVVFVPMIPVSMDTMLVVYFHIGRLTVSMLVFIAFLHTIQESEPLPKWALSSKILQNKFLSFLGKFSYGAYVYHWPIIVFFGDRTSNFGDASYHTKVVKDIIILVATLLIAYLSFTHYEAPMMMLSRVTKPKKVVTAGFAAIFFTLFIVHITTMNLPPMLTFENDASMFADAPVDDRFTPIFFQGLPNGWNAIFRKSIPHGKTFHKSNMRHILNMEENASGSVLICCTMLRNPCAYPYTWTNNTFMIQLKSPEICGDNAKEINISTVPRCDDVISLNELEFTVNQTTISKFDKLSSEYVEIIFLELLFSINDLVGDGVLNRRSIFNSRIRYQELLSGVETVMPCDPFPLTIVGESIIERIGTIWTNYMKNDMIGRASNMQNAFCPKVTNLAFGSNVAVAYFICSSQEKKDSYPFCNDTSLVSKTVQHSFQDTKPIVVVLHDQHWSSFDTSKSRYLPSTSDKVVAFNLLLSNALQNHVKSVYYLTRSPNRNVLGRGVDVNYPIEMALLQKTMDALACQNSADRKTMDRMMPIRVSVIDWAKLICPNIENTDSICNRNVHGFQNILPDGLHPYGESGDWLALQSLAVLMMDYTMSMNESNSMMSWEEAMEIPIIQYLFEKAPPDDNPPLNELITVHYLCPYRNASQLEVDLGRST